MSSVDELTATTAGSGRALGFGCVECRTGAATPLHESRHAATWTPVAHGRHAALRLILRQHSHFPVIRLLLAAFRQATDGPLVAGTDNTAPQQTVGLVKQWNQSPAEFALLSGAAQLADQIERLLQCADQVALLYSGALSNVGQVEPLGPGQGNTVEIDHQRTRHLESVTLLLAQHAAV